MSSKKATKNKKGNWISSHIGQRFFNFAYSIGAAIVIWGALFKILHLPGGNTLLSIGMGTEVLMFILTAFDRPPKEYEWERVYPQLENKEEKDTEAELDELASVPAADDEDGDGTVVSGGSVAGGGGGVVYIGGGVAGVPQGGVQGAVQGGVQGSVQTGGPAAIQGGIAAGVSAPGAGVTDVTVAYVDQLASITEDLRRLHESTNALNTVSETLLESYRAITENSENITRSSTGYVEQMAALSHNIQGLNTIYEIQLKSISSQLDSIDRVNRGIKDIRDMYEKSAEQSERYCRETEKMARYMQQLNSVYEKMITAMTINMYNPMMAGAAGAPGVTPAATTTNETDDEA